MKKILLLLFMIVTVSSFSQEKWNLDPRKMTIIGSENKDIIVEPDFNGLNYINPNTSINAVRTIDGVAIVYPNKRVHPSIYAQSEVPIVSHPTNKNILFGSANFYNFVGGFFSEGVYVTSDGGDNWFGWDTCRAAPISDHVGDPAPSINMDGRFYMSYLKKGGSGGIYVSNSIDFGNTWANATAVSSINSDKNHTVTINNPSSPYNGNTIVSWSNWVTNPNIVVSVTSDNGTTWSPMISVQTPPSGVYSQGVNGCQGPDGQVYLVWQSPKSGTPFTGKYLGFAKSTDGGFNWTANNNIYNCNGIRGTLTFGFASIRVNDFPWMGVDLTNGSRRGWIYIVTAEKDLAPAGSDPDIVFHRSSDGGSTWSEGIRVNKDELNNGKFQYMPALVVGTDGSVNIVYYDNRNTPYNDSVEVYVARSLDGGDTWTEILVSDHKFKPAGISGLAPGYQGDYIGIAEGPGFSIFPYWADNSSGIYQAWTAKVVFSAFPLNAFNLNTPAAGTTITSYQKESTAFNFTWDTSASTATYKWTFSSPAGTPKIILQSALNKVTFTSGQLDSMLAGLGLNQGDSLVGTWNVMAYRNNLPENDSLSAVNGPRNITLKRGKPSLTAFNLNVPADNSTLVTSQYNNSTVSFKWTKSGGGGDTYKLKWGPTLSNLKINIPADNSGFDTTCTIINSTLDLILQNTGVGLGDSIPGVWAVYAYTGLDSLKSIQSFNLTLKRQAKGDWIVAYDSTSANGRTSKDSITYCLGNMGKSFDLFNKAGQSSTNTISFRGYKGVIWLGAGASVMSPIQKDSIKAYINSGTTGTKARLIIFSEDIGYMFDRSSSVDTNFARQYLGINYVADAPPLGGNQGLVGDFINWGQADSTIGASPDILKASWNGGLRLYKFRSFATNGNAYGVLRATDNIAVFATDIRSLRTTSDSPPGSAVLRILRGSFNWVEETPVELVSFTVNVEQYKIDLQWVTATETNNSGFAVERKSGESRFEKIGFVSGYGTTTEMKTYYFTDDVKEGNYTYRLKQVDFDGTINYSKEINVSSITPTVYALEQNYPNPFNPSTVIKYSIPQDGLVSLQVFNVLGEGVMTLVNENMKAGKYEIKFNASSLASGIYFYRLNSGNFTSVKKMTLIK